MTRLVSAAQFLGVRRSISDGLPSGVPESVPFGPSRFDLGEAVMPSVPLGADPDRPLKQCSVALHPREDGLEASAGRSHLLDVMSPSALEWMIRQ